MPAPVLVSREAGVVHLELQRPEKKNALTMAMYEHLSAELEAAESATDVRCIVLSGSGGNFCAGNDLGDFPEPVPGEPTPVYRFLESLIDSTVPLVAAIEGNAVGIGATMLFYFDTVVAARDAKFLLPFINLALPPEAGSTLLLPRMMGYAPAAELLLRGKPFDGERALQIGMASSLAETGRALDTAMELAREYAAKAPAAVRLTKKLLKGNREEIFERIRWEERELQAALAGPESREAIAAFMERRAPDFSRGN